MRFQESFSIMDKRQTNQNPVSVIESLIANERAIVEQHRSSAYAATEPGMKSVFLRLADLHNAMYSELRLVLDDIKSRQAITDQINDVYR